MTDAISRSAVLTVGNVRKVTEYDEAGYDMTYDAVPVEAIEALPALDVAPVVHEQWIDACRGKVCICSRCGQEFDHTCNAIKDEWLFCPPKCGAKMDAEEGSNAG